MFMKKTATYSIVMAAVVFMVLYVVSCRSDKHIANVCYKEHIQPMLISNCASSGCHNPTDKASGLDLTSYEEVLKAVKPGKPSSSKLYLSVIGPNPKMPKGKAPLTARQKDILKYWINFGAQNTSCGSLACDTVSFLTYNNSVKSIMTTNCSGCHPTGHFSGHALDTYNGTKASVNSGKFIPAIKHTGPKPMPQGGGKLSDCDIAKIEKWVANGMPE